MLTFIVVVVVFFLAYCATRYVLWWIDELPDLPVEFPDSDRKHRKHLDAWTAGWRDFMTGKPVEGTKEYLEREDEIAQRQMNFVKAGLHWTFINDRDYSFSRDVSKYSEPEWSAYLAGRRAATDEKNRRATVKQARADLIDLDTEKQTRYEQALRELKEEIYGKESA